MASMVFQVLRVFILFAICTIMFYYGMIWVSQEYENYRKYDEPKGTAVKVMQQDHDEGNDWVSRLLLFYLNGE
ncbi:YqzK family protein [Siminovitchia sediminis]|uniref:YqzK family protein n=1 Tax=Siminovitchia sediminis TaxID=1274353 RepID=A0ABW4KJ52_9BACI